MVTSVTSLGCDPGPPPSRADRCTCPDGRFGTLVRGVTFHACDCPNATGAGGSGGSGDGGTDGPADVAGADGADGVDVTDSATDGRAADEPVGDGSSERPFDGSRDVE
jgi:hypothetical protein